MNVLQFTTTFVVRELVQGAAHAIGGEAGGAIAQNVVGFLSKRFTDHSKRILDALQTANDRAWRALEIAVAGDSWLERIKGRLAPGEEQAFGQQIRIYIQGNRVTATVDRQKCSEQLRTARQLKHLGGTFVPLDLARHADELARFSDATALLQRETHAVTSLAGALRSEYPHLAALLMVQAHQGETLLALGMRYFFRRIVEEDPQLARGLAFARMERLQQGQEQGFAALHKSLTQIGGRLEAILDEVRAVVVQTHGAVLDIQTEQRQQGQTQRALFEQVIALQQKFDLVRAEVRPRDSFSIQNEDERRLVKTLVNQYRTLPEDQRRRMPALLNAIGKLEVGAGDFLAAENTFRSVAHLVVDGSSQAEARFNAYHAALERRSWDSALKYLLAAVQLDPKRYAPFPVGKYHPQRILGAGGFGVAFLCLHKQLDAQVVVKSLLVDDLDGGADRVLDEARALWKLEHPAIIRLSECGYAIPATKSRPYLVMQFFPGTTLEELARRQPLASEEVVQVAQQMAAGLQAAHAQGVLHRDIKPANVLVRKDGENWQVKLIDFGLAINHEAKVDTAVATKTLRTHSIAGTLEYAAPEQMGKLPGVPPGPYSDIYGFAKTCCFALFGTSSPLPSHWKGVQPGLVKVLEECLKEDPRQRPADFGTVLELLGKVRRRRQKSAKPKEKKKAVSRPTDGEELPKAPLQAPQRAATSAAPSCSVCKTPRRGDARSCEGCGYIFPPGSSPAALPKIAADCPSCRKQLAVNREYVGKVVRCPACSKSFQVSSV